MKKTILLLSVLALAACGKPSGQAPGKSSAGAPKVGQAAPPLALNKMLRGDLAAGKDWKDLRGKAVVLEFWGTFCDPCVENVPHMNDLIGKFEGKPVVFISITKESASTVEAFLKDHPMKGNVAAESSAAYRNYFVRGIPHTVLVDGEGIIRAFSYPSLVTPASIEALLAGKPIPGAFAQEAGEAEEEGEGKTA